MAKLQAPPLAAGSFTPDQHSVETLPATRPYQPPDMRRRVGRTIWNRYSLNSHLLPEQHIVGGSTRDLLPCILRWKPTNKLTKLPVVVVEQELGLVLEAGVPDLLFRPLKGWMISDAPGDDLSICELHDDEYVKDTKPNCVLHQEVTAPHALSLILQKASPGLRICGSQAPIDHVFPDGRASVANTELHLQLQGDAILSVLRMIRGYPPDEVDVFIGNCRSAWPALGLPPPELPKLPLPPSDHGLWPYQNQFRSPVSPNL